MDKEITVIKQNKQEALVIARQKLNDFKYSLLKEALDYRNIEYDHSIEDYNSFISSLKTTLSPEKYNLEVEPIIKKLDQEMARIFIDLNNGSTNSFTNFIKEKYEEIIMPISDKAVTELKSNYNINITNVNRVKLEEAKGLYKVLKGNKTRLIANKNYEINKIIQELETTRDKQGKIINTRFSSDVEKEIRTFFQNHHIAFEDTGYLSLRHAIYSLDYETKLVLADTINKKMGSFINIGSRISQYDTGFFTKLNNNVLKPVGSGIAIGASAAAVVNTIDPAILSGPINGFVSQYLVNSNIVGLSNVGKWIVGLGGTAGSFGLERIPYIGGFFERTFKLENIVALGLAGGSAILAGLTAIGAVKAVKRIATTVDEGLTQKKIDKIDLQLYGENVRKEYLRVINNKINNNSNLDENLIIDTVLNYEKELGIINSENPKSFQELNKHLDTLNSNYKNQIRILYEDLLKLDKEDKNKLLEMFAKSMKYNTFADSLGISYTMQDSLKASGILEKIREKEIFTLPKDNNDKAITDEDLVETLKNCINENNVDSFIHLCTRLKNNNIDIPIEAMFDGFDIEKIKDFINLLSYSNIDKDLLVLISNKVKENNLVANDDYVKVA